MNRRSWGSDSIDHRLLAGGHVDNPAVPFPASLTACVDNHLAPILVCNHATTCEHRDLHVSCVSRHDMPCSQPRADRYILAVSRWIDDE